MKVAICDDDSLVIKQLQEIVYSYTKEHRISTLIEQFSGGEELLKSQQSFDIVFLDYSMNGISGLETAKKIRKADIKCSIIFVTSFPEFVLDSFEVSTFRFILKPIQRDKIISALNDYVTLTDKNYPVSIVVDGTMVRVNSNDIIFLEAEGKYTLVHTRESCYRSSKTLSAICSLVPEYCFFRTHHSYCVNMHYVKSFTNDTIELLTGEKIYISKRNEKPFREAYLNFVDSNYVKL